MATSPATSARSYAVCPPSTRTSTPARPGSRTAPSPRGAGRWSQDVGTQPGSCPSAWTTAAGARLPRHSGGPQAWRCSAADPGSSRRTALANQWSQWSWVLTTTSGRAVSRAPPAGPDGLAGPAAGVDDEGPLFTAHEDAGEPDGGRADPPHRVADAFDLDARHGRQRRRSSTTVSRAGRSASGTTRCRSSARSTTTGRPSTEATTCSGSRRIAGPAARPPLEEVAARVADDEHRAPGRQACRPPRSRHPTCHGAGGGSRRRQGPGRPHRRGRWHRRRRRSAATHAPRAGWRPGRRPAARPPG